jgi:hypothetical protein
VDLHDLPLLTANAAHPLNENVRSALHIPTGLLIERDTHSDTPGSGEGVMCSSFGWQLVAQMSIQARHDVVIGDRIVSELASGELYRHLLSRFGLRLQASTSK